MLFELEELGVDDERMPDFCAKWTKYLQTRLRYTRESEMADFAVATDDSREADINGAWW